jgi:hypothetical protein
MNRVVEVNPVPEVCRRCDCRVMVANSRMVGKLEVILAYACFGTGPGITFGMPVILTPFLLLNK